MSQRSSVVWQYANSTWHFLGGIHSSAHLPCMPTSIPEPPKIQTRHLFLDSDVCSRACCRLGRDGTCPVSRNRYSRHVSRDLLPGTDSCFILSWPTCVCQKHISLPWLLPLLGLESSLRSRDGCGRQSVPRSQSPVRRHSLPSSDKRDFRTYHCSNNCCRFTHTYTYGRTPTLDATMIAATRRWVHSNRKRIAIGAGVIGAGYVAGQYVLGKISEARQRMGEDRIAKEK